MAVAGEDQEAKTSLSESVRDLRSQLTVAMSSLEEVREELSKERHDQEAKTSLAESVRNLRSRLSAALTSLEEVREELSKERQSRQEQTSQLEAQVAEKTSDAESFLQEKRILEVEFHSYKEHHGTSNHQQMEAIADLKLTVDKLSQQYESTQVELAVQASSAAHQQSYITSLQQQVASAEAQRRALHNTIQELKGSIRVMCRVR